MKGPVGIGSFEYYPAGRYYSTIDFDSRDNLWLFSGADNGNSYQANKLWVFNANNDAPEWISEETMREYNHSQSFSISANMIVSDDSLY